MAKNEAAGGMNDARLMTLIRAGDEHAMTALYDRYSRIVYAVALRVLADPATAEDVLQEIFMHLWRSPQIYDPARGSMAAWLAVVTRHRAIDLLRKRRPETEIDELSLSMDVALDDQAHRNIVMEKVRTVLNGLPQEQRSPMELAFFEGLTHSEIAKKTGQPLGTVKTRIRSALAALRAAFGSNIMKDTAENSR